MRCRNFCLIACVMALAGGSLRAADDESARPSRLTRWLHRKSAPRMVPSPPKIARTADLDVKKVQAENPRRVPLTPADPLLSAPPSLPSPLLPDVGNSVPSPVGSQSLSLEAALNGALTSNPDLVTLRQGNAISNAPSPEAVEVARRFPTTLNPTIWLDYRPIGLIPTFPDGSRGFRNPNQDYYRNGRGYLYLSYRQPIELAHQTSHRFDIAKAALDQQQWTVMQAELTALVQTYRLFQTAAYRREKYKVALDLADSNDRLLESLQKRLDANQAQAADVILARVESRSARQQVKAVRQDYLTALADLSNQVGVPEAAGAAEPLGEFTLPSTIPPLDEQAMIETALASRPDIHAARAQIRGNEAATRLARADRIPTPVIGPEYQHDQNGVQTIGMVYITPLPIINSGKALVWQREAEARRAYVALQQAQKRCISQVRAAVSRWNGATDLVAESNGLTDELAGEVTKLERLFEEGQADLTRLLQGRQRLIQLENQRLDAVWAATQAQADLLLALGTPTLINAMLARAENDALGVVPLDPRQPVVPPASSPPFAP